MCNRPVPLHRTARARTVTRMGRHAGSRPLDVRAARSSPSRHRAPDEVVERACAESLGGASMYGLAAWLLRSCRAGRGVAGAAGAVHLGESGARRSCRADWRVSICMVGLVVMPASGRHYQSKGEAQIAFRHYQSMFSTAIRCSAPLARASAVVGLVVMPASGRHYQSMFSTAIRCSAPLARASAVVGLVVMRASGRHYQFVFSAACVSASASRYLHRWRHRPAAPAATTTYPRSR